MTSHNQRTEPESAEVAEDTGSRFTPADPDHHEIVTKHLDVCGPCFKARFHELQDLDALTSDLRLENPYASAYSTHVSAEIANAHHRCWFCRLIYRFCARSMPDEVFGRWCTENIEVAFVPSGGIFKAQFLGAGDAERSEITFLVRTGGLNLPFHQFYLTCYFKHDVPSRTIDSVVPKVISEDGHYARKIKRWISHCDSSHSRCVSLRGLMPSLEHELDLINVETREIVTVTSGSCRYLALSFVWGDSPMQKYWPSDDSQDTLGDIVRRARRARILPAGLPSTFEDAMFVTISLGETFIWIDCFCIEQDDPKLRQLAIENMDVIYSGAALTICALDSGDVFGPIPGVGVPHEEAVRVSSETESGCYYATQYEYLSTVLEECGWSSRGWTFQEAALSTRRLCFYQQGSFLLCSEEMSHSVMRFDQSKDRLPGFFDSGRDYGFPFNIDLAATSWDFEVYSRIVTAYTRRKLTFQSDALGALTGALRRINRNTSTDFPAGLPQQDLMNGLLWSHPRPASLNGPFVTMDEIHDSRAHRRREFPSWTWLGWQAPAKYLYWTIPGSVGSGHVFSVNDDGRFLYKDAVRMKACATANIEPPLEPGKQPILVLKTQAVTLPVCRASETDASRAANGDHWLISSVHGEPVVISVPGNPVFHNDTLVHFYWDASTNQVRCSVNLHQCVSNRLSEKRTQKLRFVMLQHWVPTGVNEPKKVHEESWSGEPGDMAGLEERVWVMAVEASGQADMERLGVTWIPGAAFEEAGPEDVTVRIA